MISHSMVAAALAHGLNGYQPRINIDDSGCKQTREDPYVY